MYAIWQRVKFGTKVRDLNVLFSLNVVFAEWRMGQQCEIPNYFFTFDSKDYIFTKVWQNGVD